MESTPTLQIIPDILEFHPPYSRVITNTIKLTNTSQERWVCFKVKTTSPKRYTVRPSIAVIPPLETYSVQVTLNLSKEPVEENGKDRDRFQIQSIFVPSSIDPKAFDPKNMWNELPQDQIMKYRLKTSKFTTSSSSRPSETHHQDDDARGLPVTDWSESVESKVDYGRTESQAFPQTPVDTHSELTSTDAGSLESSTSSPYSTPSSSILDLPTPPHSTTSQNPQQPSEKDPLTSKIDELAAKYKRSGVEVGGGLTLRQRAGINNLNPGSKDGERPKSERPATSLTPPSSQSISLETVMVQTYSFQTVVIIALLSFLFGYFLKSIA